MVALGNRTQSGRTIFSKNSDRPALECQPLFWEPATRFREGETLRCQYVEIEQVPETFALVGARPNWLWGLEHGVNEMGVAIGNHTIFTRDAVADTGLLGMDLVRLGLERGASAGAAAGVIIELVERYGQGGSGYSDTHWPYHNSFLIADAREALLLETSASRWALKRATDGALAASSHASITTDWDELGHDTIEHAIARDWWPEPTGVRFDFARAYRNLDLAPAVISSGRYATTCQALESAGLDVASVQRVMRDHYGSGDVHAPGASPDDEKYFSVCMHADPVGTTTASMVVELPGPDGGPLLAWMALGNPCVVPYLPVFVGAPLPYALCSDGPAGAWRLFKQLLCEVEKDFTTRGRCVRSFWKEHEAAIAAGAQAFLGNLPPPAERTAAAQLFMENAWDATALAAGRLSALVASL
jgi:secernin